MIDSGRGVKLDTIDKTNSDLLRHWRNDPAIYKFCRQYDLITEAQHEGWLEWQATSKDARMYLIRAAQGSAVGVCGLTDIDLINRRAEFSLYIEPSNQRSGHAQAALSTLLDHGFKSFGLNCIFGETFAGNVAAKMFEGLGFTLEGARRDFYFREGRFIDAHLYSILACEWLK